MAWASSSESSVHSLSAQSNVDKNPFLSAVFVGSETNVLEGPSPRHRPFRHQASTSSGEFLEPVSPGPSPSVSASWPQQIDAVELQQLDVIGSGGCGLVFRGKWGNKMVAIKQINQDSLENKGAGPEGCPMSTEAWLQRFFNEAQTIWLARDHPNVVQLLGVCLQKYWLVFEYCAGGGLDYVINRCRLAPAVIVEWATQISCGMEWLHSVGIIHRDLKSCNILLKYPLPQLQFNDAISELDSSHQSLGNLSEDQWSQPDSYQPVILKIADFGLARQLSLDSTRVTEKHAEGTVRYLAPEVITSRTYSKASDVWSYGVVFWELLTGEQPYRDVEECAVMFRVGRQRRSLLPVPPSCPPAFASLLNDCWSSDPFNRPSFTIIVDRLSLSDLRVAEFTKTGTEFSSLQDSWRQIIENAFNELRVRQEELELADLALRQRAAQQQIIDNRLRQWERQLAQRELRVVERELRTLFLDDQNWSNRSNPVYRSFDTKNSRSASETRFSLSALLLPRLGSSAKLRPPNRVSLSHLRRDRNLISRPLMSTMQVSHFVSPSPVVDTESNVIHHHHLIGQPTAPSASPRTVAKHVATSRPPQKISNSRIRQAITGASRLLAAVLIGHDPSGPRPPQIPLISTIDSTPQEAPSIVDFEKGSVISDSVLTCKNVSTQQFYSSTSTIHPHVFYIGEECSPTTEQKMIDKLPNLMSVGEKPLNERPGTLPFSPQHEVTIEGVASGCQSSTSVQQTQPQSADSGMALSSLSFGSVSGASGSQTSATTPLDANSQTRRLSTAAVNEAFFKSGYAHALAHGRTSQHMLNIARYRQHQQSLSTDLEDSKPHRYNKQRASPGPPESVVSEPGGTVKTQGYGNKQNTSAEQPHRALNCD